MIHTSGRGKQLGAFYLHVMSAVTPYARHATRACHTSQIIASFLSWGGGCGGCHVCVAKRRSVLVAAQAGKARGRSSQPELPSEQLTETVFELPGGIDETAAFPLLSFQQLFTNFVSEFPFTFRHGTPARKWFPALTGATTPCREVRGGGNARHTLQVCQHVFVVEYEVNAFDRKDTFMVRF